MKRRFSSPMAGMLTRSRAEVFVHRSRSGRARPDPAGWKLLHDDPIHPSPLSLDDAPVSIKSRRFFSRRYFPDMPGKIDSCSVDLKGPEIEPSDGSEIKHIKSPDELTSLIQDPDNKGEIFCQQITRGLGESKQSTPRDVDVLRRAEAVLDLEPLGKACVEELVKASGEHQPATDVGSVRLRRNSLKNKSIITSRSRSKLYQNPSSFGYRRLLPYLLDIEKESSDKMRSGCEEIIPPSVDSVKVEETEEVPVLSNAFLSPAQKDDIIEPEIKPEQQTHDLDSSNVNKMCELSPSSYVDSMMLVESIGGSPSDDADSEEKHVTVNSISLPETAPCSEEKHVTVNSISLPETAPCSRSKLYRNPNSYGYRRLLPYLQDIKKDIPGGEVILEHQALEELPINANVDSSPALIDDGVELIEGSPTTRIADTSEDNKNPDSVNSNHSLIESALDVVVAEESSNPFGLNSSQAPMISDLEMMQFCDSSSYSPANSVALSTKELAGSMSDGQSSQLARKEPLPVAPKLRRSGPGSHALAPRKSLLKKYTRRCKGLCMCLDCASFRLHAERDFEFSRRQLLEADGIVTSLMKELACLRKIMEKSALPQVKEVCRNALKVDQAAKSRMSHLIREMNIHCRLPGPRVTFADPIEEIRIFDSDRR